MSEMFFFPDFGWALYLSVLIVQRVGEKKILIIPSFGLHWRNQALINYHCRKYIEASNQVLHSYLLHPMIAEIRHL